MRTLHYTTCLFPLFISSTYLHFALVFPVTIECDLLVFSSLFLHNSMTEEKVTSSTTCTFPLWNDFTMEFFFNIRIITMQDTSLPQHKNSTQYCTDRQHVSTRMKDYITRQDLLVDSKQTRAPFRKNHTATIRTSATIRG